MNLVSGLFKTLHWPMCRAYARHMGDKPADSLLQCLSSLEFRRTYGFWPNFAQPSRFSEKVWSRQLFDRDARLTIVVDKLRVRDYVAQRVGGDYLIPLLWDGNKPEEIPFDRLPRQFVIKTNHGCGYNIIVKDKHQLDQKKTRRQVKKWMGVNFCTDAALGIAWGYRNIKPRVMIESLLGDNGSIPIDYKFFCYMGRMEFFKLDFCRFEDHSERFFDRDLRPLDLVEVGLKRYQGEVNFPDNLQAMFQVAESLAQGFDFMRVDLYTTAGRIFFGELTPYPGGIAAKFEPEYLDYKFGEKWKQM